MGMPKANGTTAPPDSCRLAMLGAPLLEGPAGGCHIPGTPARALLYYLASYPGHTFSRSHLVSLIWEESSESKGRNNLSSHLSNLRSLLPAWPLVSQGDNLSWPADGPIALDVADFLQLARHADPEAAGATDREDRRDQRDQRDQRTAPSVSRLKKAADIWRGPFLDGFSLPGSTTYESWLERERLRWDQHMVEILLRIVESEAVAGRWESVLSYARAGLAIDDLHDRMHRSAMMALYHLGDRAVALAHYARYREAILDEFGVEPDSATVALRDEIAAGLPRIQAPAAPSDLSAPAAFTPSQPPAEPILVGRGADLTRLTASLAAVRNGQGRMVLLHGEAGIGKSTLAREATRAWQQSDSPGLLLTGHCYETSSDLPYAPVTEILQGLLPEVRRLAVPLPNGWEEAFARLVPGLTNSWAPIEESPREQTNDTARLQVRPLFDLVALMLRSVPGPVLILLEDVHWADPHTLSLVAYLVRSSLSPNTAILATARPEDLPEPVMRLLVRLQQEERLHWHSLERLSPESIRSMAAMVTGQDWSALSDRIFQESRGNPLFAGHLLRSLKESGRLDGQIPDLLDALPLPSTITGVVNDRLSRLSQPARSLIEAASIFPGPTSFVQLARTADQIEGKAAGALRSLVRSALLREQPSGDPGQNDEPVILFQHDLVRRVVQDGLTETERALLHRRAYHALADSLPVPEPGAPSVPLSFATAESLAFHAARGKLWQEALNWNEQAALTALQASLHSTESRFLEQALLALEQLKPTPQFRRKAVDFRLRLNLSYFYVQPSRMQAALARAAADAEALNDDVRLARVWVGQSSERFGQGQYSASMALLQRVDVVVRKSGDERLQAGYLRSLGLTQLLQGDCRRAIATLADASRLDEQYGNPLKVAVDKACVALAYGFLGEFNQSEALFAHLVHSDPDPELIPTTALALGFRAMAKAVHGQWDQLGQISEVAVSQAEQTEHSYQRHMAHLCLGLARFHSGERQAGLQTQADAIAWSRSVPMHLFLSLAEAWLAEMYLEAGDSRRAQTLARETAKTAQEQGAAHVLAICERTLGRVAAQAGQVDLAYQHLSEALQRLSARDLQPDMARCHALLADVAPTWRAEHRSAAKHLFRRMGMTWDLRRLEDAAGRRR